jgi:ribosome-associated protein
MDEDDFISKTRRKREAKELQDVGAGLVALSKEELSRIDMPEELREAVVECQRITKHEGRRRQMQYIGRIMRNLEVGPIAAQLTAMHAPSKRQTALFHLAEKWRDELIADPEAAKRLALEFDRADVDRLRTLAERARAEKESGAPTPKNARLLFHALNALIQDHGRKKA